MLRGIYIAGSGMLAESVRQEVVANNLANALTTGFKRTDSATRPFETMLLRNMGMPGQPEVGSTDMGAEIHRLDVVAEQGPLKNTGNQLDLALAGDGWFAVRATGGTRYTRDGSFGIDADGTLVTKDGHAVLGQDGPIRLARDAAVGVQQDGSITQDGRIVGRLQVVALRGDSLATEGGNLVTGTVGGTPTARVRQGYLEGSTVNVVSEMVELIRVMRSFESNQKAVQAHDETLQQALTRVGVVV
jgi:flagellar basal-body rod protein FlgG